MNKKVWLVLSVGLSFLSLESSVEEGSDGSGLLLSLIVPSLVREMDRQQPDSDLMRMSWSDPRVAAVERRMRILEENQIQQDIRMQRQNDEIAGLQKIVAQQKIALLATINQVKSSLAEMLTQKVIEIHVKSVGVENSIRAIQNSLALQAAHIRKLSGFSRVGSGKVKFVSSAGKKQGKKKK